MAKKNRLKGIPEWQRSLNRKVGKIVGLSEAGVLAAAQYVGRKSGQEVPVATGNLRNSRYVVSSSGKVISEPKFKGEEQETAKLKSGHSAAVAGAQGDARAMKLRIGPSAWLGYSAVYALSVHENRRAGQTEGVSPQGKKYTAGLTEKGNKSTRVVWATKGKWKFLEDPLKNSVGKVVQIIKKHARKKVK